MKTALLSDGMEIVAGAAAPTVARCPRCGCVVCLRTRRSMNGRTTTYYWRHSSQKAGHCVERRSPLFR